MLLGIPRESHAGETRVAATPDTVRKLASLGLTVLIEHGAGSAACFPDAAYEQAGARLGSASEALAADIVFKVRGPDAGELAQIRRGALLCALLDACDNAKLEPLATAGVDALALERIPRISRAQGMDVLSSQANIAGYRAVIEAATLYGRFFPLMMTSAGSAKAARVVVLGAGVAGLQAIATARRLGAQVHGYDVRAAVKEQVLSLGAKFIELDLGESGEGVGGYAKALSQEAQQRQIDLLGKELAKADIIISTALIPCRPAPVLISEQAVAAMAPGSVIVDMAAASGGNCPLTHADEIINHHGVTICGLTNFPARAPGDASQFLARNLYNLIALVVERTDAGARLKDLLEDEITRAALVTHQGALRPASN
jgi:NAD(P) transhydrogenase subunit alpha